MSNSQNLIDRLRILLAQDRVSEAEFSVAVAEIVAASPEGIGASESLMLSQEIRQLEKEWLESCHRPSN